MPTGRESHRSYGDDALTPNIAELSAEDREVLESWVVEFDRRWEDGLLDRQADQIPPQSAWRLKAMAEMVKIDIDRQWRRGKESGVESYLERFPELARRDDLSADLILAEFEARRKSGAPADLEGYLRRFPEHAGEIARRIASGGSSSPRHDPPSMGPRKPSTPPPDVLPERLGRYKVIKRLGQGGMGSVFLAEDTQLGRKVALKVPHFGPDEGPEARERFFREARTAATLDHPYLCPVYDVGEIDGRLYLTMAFIEGKSLAESLKGQGMPTKQVAALVGKLALALQQAHAKGVVHRDLKPANVMIKVDGTRREPVIVDFGLALRDDGDSRMTKSGQVMGTLAYMSPEQVMGDLATIGPPSDIFALGVILYELLTGRVPFNGAGLAIAGQILTQNPLAPSSIREGLDPRIEAICLKAMSKKPADRYASMADLAAALTGFLQAPSPSSTESAPPKSSPSADSAGPKTSGGDRLMAEFFQGLATGDSVGPRVAPKSRKPSAVPSKLLDIDPGEDVEPMLAPRASSDVRPPWLIPAISTGVLALCLIVAMVIISLMTKNGTILIKNLPEDAEVFVDGDKFTIKLVDGGLYEVTIPVGKRGVEVRLNGLKVYGEEVTVEAGKGKEIVVGYKPPEAVAATPPAPMPDVSTPPTRPVPTPEVASATPRSTRPEPPRPPGPEAPSLAFYPPTTPPPDHSEVFETPNVRPTLMAYYHGASPPIADGNIAFSEYAPGVVVDFARGSKLGAILGVGDKSLTKTPDDLSVKMHASYSDKSLFLGFRVRDQFIDAQPSDAAKPHLNDSVEVFLDGDRVANDFDPAKPSRASSEGFQIMADTLGNQHTFSADFTNAGWKTKTRREPGGYVMEFEIPLALIDVADGDRKQPAGPGSMLNLGLAIGDNDVETDQKMSHAYIRADKRDKPPYVGLEPAWTLGIKLEDWEPPRPVSPPEPGWTSLFNGKDIEGWTAYDGKGPMRYISPHWVVRDGILHSEGGITHLFSPIGDYRNFRVRAEVKINANGNSGLYFRAIKGPGFPGGYEAQINSAAADPARTGSLYISGRRDPIAVSPSPVPPETWCVLEVKAVGDEIWTFVDGKEYAHRKGPASAFQRGYFALQAHDTVTHLQLRRLEVMELDDSGKPDRRGDRVDLRRRLPPDLRRQGPGRVEGRRRRRGHLGRRGRADRRRAGRPEEAVLAALGRGVHQLQPPFRGLHAQADGHRGRDLGGVRRGQPGRDQPPELRQRRGADGLGPLDQPVERRGLPPPRPPGHAHARRPVEHGPGRDARRSPEGLVQRPGHPGHQHLNPRRRARRPAGPQAGQGPDRLPGPQQHRPVPQRRDQAPLGPGKTPTSSWWSGTPCPLYSLLLEEMEDAGTESRATRIPFTPRTWPMPGASPSRP